MKKKYFIIISLLSLGACKKPDPLENEIIKENKPNEYFPFYPGSNWTYTNDSNKTYYYSSNPYFEYEDYNSEINPIWVNSLDNIIISGRSLLFIDHFYNFICTKKNDEYNFRLRAVGDFRYNPPTFNYSLKFMGHLDTLVVHGKKFNDIYVSEFTILDVFNQTPSTMAYKNHLLVNAINYFAKDVGIILQKKVITSDSLPNDTVVTRELIDYKIGPH